MDFNEIISKITAWISVPLFELRGNPISVKSLIVLASLLWGFYWLSKWIEKFAHKTLLYKDIDPGIKGSIERFSRYFILIIGTFVSLSSIGINLTTLTAVGGFALVGIGFGLQNITQNFMSGIVILLERPIKKGDIVRVGDTSGRVLDIKARSTLVLTRDDVVMIVPNSDFISKQVVNDSFSGDKLRLHVDVGVAYDSDIDTVTKVLMDVASRHDKVLTSPPPTVVLKEFADSSLNFTLRIWTSELWFFDLLLSELRYEIVREFRKKGVTIPFPQRDLHLRSVSAERPLGIQSVASVRKPGDH
jgi:small-conductance mechanosensitive channel